MLKLGALAGAFCVALLLSGCASSRPAPYPLGIYSVSDTNDFALIAAVGFNLIRGPANHSFLDAAHHHELRVLAAPNTVAGKTFDSERAREAVRKLDHHPALWAWYIIDEPDLNLVAPVDVEIAQRVVRKAGARKPTALVIYKGESALEYANIADITMIDRYPVPWLPLASFPQHVRMTRLALGKQKPMIAVIQAFDWSYYPDLLPGEENLRPPSYLELRCMTYAALAQRANGLFFYCFDDGRWKIREHEEQWEDLKLIVGEVHERLPLFEAEHVWWRKVDAYLQPEKAFNAALEASIQTALLRVRRGNEFVPSGDYILAINTTADRLDYRFFLPRWFGGDLPVLGEARHRPIDKNWVEDRFEAYAVHIYGPLPLP